MSSAILRIVTAGILAGVLIESGAAARIADTIMKKLGESKSLIAMMLATWILTAVGVFGDVAVITVAPIAIQLAKKELDLKTWSIVCNDRWSKSW